MSESRIIEVTKRQGRAGFNTGRDVHGEPLDRTDFGPPFPVYKIVRRSTWGVQHRWVSERVTGQGRVVYQVGVPAMAPPWLRYYGYHLMAHDTLARAAGRWYWYPSQSRYDYEVFEADGEGAAALPSSAALTGPGRNRLRIHRGYFGWWEEGTVMVRRLTLRRRVEDDELMCILERALGAAPNPAPPRGRPPARLRDSESVMSDPHRHRCPTGDLLYDEADAVVFFDAVDRVWVLAMPNLDDRYGWDKDRTEPHPLESRRIDAYLSWVYVDACPWCGVRLEGYPAPMTAACGGAR